MMRELLGFVRLEVLRQWRRHDMLLWRLGMPVGLYLFFRLTLDSDSGDTFEGLPSDLAAMVVFAVVGVAYSGLYAAGPPLAHERAIGWLRQLRVTPLPASARSPGRSPQL